MANRDRSDGVANGDTTVGYNGNGAVSTWVSILFKFGIPGFLCLAFAWLIAREVPARLDVLEIELRTHSIQMQLNYQQSAMYLHSICVSMSVQSGTPLENCPAVPPQADVSSFLPEHRMAR